jgi:hypothetical protein
MHGIADFELTAIYRRFVSKNPYELNAPAPKQVSATKPRGGAGIGTAALAIVGVIAALIAVMYFAKCGGGPDESVARCDSSGDDARYAWIATPLDDHRGATPHDLGLQVDGKCARGIREKELTCTEEALRGLLDDPMYKRAAAVGFTSFVCVEMSSGKETTFPLPSLLPR